MNASVALRRIMPTLQVEVKAANELQRRVAECTPLQLRSTLEVMAASAETVGLALELDNERGARAVGEAAGRALRAAHTLVDAGAKELDVRQLLERAVIIGRFDARMPMRRFGGQR